MAPQSRRVYLYEENKQKQKPEGHHLRVRMETRGRLTVLSTTEYREAICALRVCLFDCLKALILLRDGVSFLPVIVEEASPGGKALK